VLICPSDRISPLRKPPEYPYSYVFNRMFNGSSSPPAGIKRITECRNTSEKVWIYEEDDAERDDGNGELWTTNWDKTDLLSIRHDERGKKLPDVANAAGLVNNKKKGNVCFADGHAEFVARNYAHAKSHSVPNPTRVTGTEIVILN
jgi:prepilin-type processing-associated H-X9-DG protein